MTPAMRQALRSSIAMQTLLLEIEDNALSTRMALVSLADIHAQQRRDYVAIHTLLSGDPAK